MKGPWVGFQTEAKVCAADHFPLGQSGGGVKGLIEIHQPFVEEAINSRGSRVRGKSWIEIGRRARQTEAYCLRRGNGAASKEKNPNQAKSGHNGLAR